MYYLLAVPLILSAFFLHQWFRAPAASPEDIAAEIGQSPALQKQVFGAMEKSVRRLDGEAIVPADLDRSRSELLSRFNLQDETQQRLAQYLTERWRRSADVDARSLHDVLREQYQRDPEGTFQSVKYAMLQFTPNGFFHERAVLLEFLKDLDFDGANDEVKRLAHAQLQLSAHGANAPSQFLMEMMTTYLDHCLVAGEGLEEATAIIEQVENQTVRAHLQSVYRMKFPESDPEVADRAPANDEAEDTDDAEAAD